MMLKADTKQSIYHHGCIELWYWKCRCIYQFEKWKIIQNFCVIHLIWNKISTILCVWIEKMFDTLMIHILVLIATSHESFFFGSNFRFFFFLNNNIYAVVDIINNQNETWKKQQIRFDEKKIHHFWYCSKKNENSDKIEILFE